MNNIDGNVINLIISVIGGIVTVIVLRLISKSWMALVNTIDKKNKRGAILYDRRYLILFQSITVLTLSLITYLIFKKTFTENGVISLLLVCFSLLLYIIFSELLGFWRIGLTHITSKISKDTYKRAFNSTHKNFSLVGTNAYNFAKLEEFERMLKRIKECRGSTRLLLAHPSSRGLKEAARNRGLKDNYYQNQAKISLGHLINLRNTLGLNLDIALYHANSIENLPIFRSMFLDDSFCVASIAVYGREDHGSVFPQIYAKSTVPVGNAPKSMYNVVYRYFCTILDDSQRMTPNEEKSYITAWKRSIFNDKV